MISCLAHPVHACCFIIVGVIGLLARAFAQGEVSHDHSAGFHIRHFTSENGLPQNTVQALAQTPDGYLWMGTWFGLARFDGVNPKVFDQFNTPQLTSGPITALAVDRGDGALWIGTRDGLVRFNEGRFTRFAQADGLPDADISQLVAVAGGGVWLRTDKLSLVLWRDGRSVTSLRLEGTLKLIGGQDDSVTAVTLSGVKRVTCGGKVSDVAPLTDAVFADATTCEWPAGWPKDPIRLEHGAEKRAACTLVDREGHLWIGTADGLFQVRPKLIRAFSTEEGLPSPSCWSVCEGPDNAIWVGTSLGVARIADKDITTRMNEPIDADAARFLIDADGWLWKGNRNFRGLSIWQPGVATNSFWTNGMTVQSFYLDRQERVWVGTGRGVMWFTSRQPAGEFGDFGLPTNDVRAAYQSHDGAMWFGTWGGGAVRWTVSKSETRNPKSEINQSLLTPAATRFTTTNGLADDRVFVFHEDAERVLWIGTHNGLSRFKDGRFFTFRTEHGLLDNLINHLEEDDFGQFWFSCNRGIFRIARAELNAVAEGKQVRANVAVYGTADGMLNPETNGEHQPAGCKGRDGRIWFPTAQGVVVIDPRSASSPELPPPVVIEEVVVDREVVEIRNPKSEIPSLRLAPGRAREMQFHYTANSFADPRRVRFRYRLAGHESDWRPETDERVAYYTNLRPGDYRFEVQACNHHGVWNETPEAFAFSLAPHFWQTWPFYLGCATAVIGLAGGIQSYRLRWQRRVLKLEEQRTLANERTRIARDLHDDLGTALTGLALELDVIGREANGAATVAERLSQSARQTRELAERMREVVWTVNPACDTVSGLASFLEQQIGQFLRASDLRLRLDFPEDIPQAPLGAEARHQLALSVREALTNVVRHARATEVVLSLAIEASNLVVCVQDNGVGCPTACLTDTTTHGLGNLHARMKRLGGSLECLSASGTGTRLTFRVPLEPRAKSPMEIE